MKTSEEHIDVAEAQAILDADHYDLTDVKERIVEYLAVRKLKPDLKGPILCFVGPPGVGKTSLGRSIARAMGREFVRVSLGGIRDEAEIRGHRRTYVGAMPGRIIQGIRNAGVCNPVFMLDEIDKVGADYRGDPTSALLEVLDPQQNDSFSDHYLEVPFDLSSVIFVTTANVLATIPAPLLDRMEVLHLPGYTDEEKIEIARRYLIPRQTEAHGLKPDRVRFSDTALATIIRGFTREAGVRNLERTLATVCRKCARRAVEGEKKIFRVTGKNLEEFLGPQPFHSDVAERIDTPGVVCGLAWTQAGGEILFVEATQMPGHENLVLTGQLGDVMQESARAALSWVRSNAQKLGLAPDFFSGIDLHLHVPAGATPKDGPSAGVAMATVLTGLLTGRRARNNVAMTGEITLRGKVLRIGGVKEKVLAAKRAGITTVILPQGNESDVRELEEAMVEGMTFVFASVVEEVLAAALEPPR
jgi:ATP-dependent Lon protease